MGQRVEPKLVIRPDSGDPVKIICGDPDAEPGSPAARGVVELLYGIFGGTFNEAGFVTLNSHIGAIYGDSINLDRANRIAQGLADKGFAFDNIVFGIGSFTYQFNTRDTHGFAMKATWSLVGDDEHLLFKDPVTDDGSKRSARGRVAVARQNGVLRLVDGLNYEEWVSAANYDELSIVYSNGVHINVQTLDEIRANVKVEVAKRRKV